MPELPLDSSPLAVPASTSTGKERSRVSATCGAGGVAVTPRPDGPAAAAAAIPATVPTAAVGTAATPAAAGPAAAGSLVRRETARSEPDSLVLRYVDMLIMRYRAASASESLTRRCDAVLLLVRRWCCCCCCHTCSSLITAIMGSASPGSLVAVLRFSLTGVPTTPSATTVRPSVLSANVLAMLPPTGVTGRRMYSTPPPAAAAPPAAAGQDGSRTPRLPGGGKVEKKAALPSWLLLGL